jgi:hypothetical protein
MQEWHKQCTDFRHPLFGHNAAQKHLKSLSSFLHSVVVPAIPNTSDVRLNNGQQGCKTFRQEQIWE